MGTPIFKKGFTLIELLIAIFVLSVGLVAVLQAFPMGAYIQKTAQMTTTAVHISQDKMEEVISWQYAEIIVGETNEVYGFDADNPSFRRETEVSYFDPNNPGVPPAEDSGIKKVRISVFWHSHLGLLEKEVKIATLIARK
ncbi:MAG: prepilin-type N-terminal cleavage/methylation domain-containing protein [bacterium]|nr:prepilin-type N-terminal cleavage/methylation domain-containing protein [bacterium]